jgi:hypothetical protein
MFDVLLPVFATIGVIWILSLLWAKVSLLHKKTMKNVDPCRPSAGCESCHLDCHQRPEVVPEKG